MDIAAVLNQLNEVVSAASSLTDHEYFLKTDSKYEQCIADLLTLTDALFNKIIGKLEHLGMKSYHYCYSCLP